MVVIIGGWVSMECGYLFTFIPPVESVWAIVIAAPFMQFVVFVFCFLLRITCLSRLM